MSLRLVIEHAPHPQRIAERTHAGGDLKIGRGAEADWQIDDPDQFVSRLHCVISGAEGRFQVTDASRGGLYIDGRDVPLGAGNSVALEHGMRLRLGDVVLRVEIEGGRSAALRPPAVPTGARPAPAFAADDFFAPRPAAPPPPRPETLPEPFETGRPSAAAQRPAAPAAPPLFDDPFTLDPLPAARPDPPAAAGFGEPPTAPSPPPPPQADPFGDWPAPAAPESAAQPAPPPPVAQPAAPVSDAALWAAFLRGMGLPETAAEATPEQMEAMGRRFRLLAEGLTQLLRARAREKQEVRLAQTIIGSAEVNPLKFLPTAEEALAALVAPRGPGYLAPDEAIEGAFRDLADHRIRAWGAMQAALRRMIDRFDPEEIERQSEADGLMRKILSGGRAARLWQLYTEHYRDIAKAAEDRFLGEVGADFRDAYEANRRE